MNKVYKKNRIARQQIGILSGLVLLIIVFIFSPYNTLKFLVTNFDYTLLPHFNAFLNSMCVLTLLLAFRSIKKRQIKNHKRFMNATFILSTLFLISYIIYHSGAQHVIFGDIDKNGILSFDEKALLSSYIRGIYLFILITHILCSIIIIPMVLYSFYLGYTLQRKLHKQIVRWTFPIWLYVAISGVTVYLFIRTYY